jgi:hypothetical protein
MDDETKLRRDETILANRRRHPETDAGYQMVNETTGRKGLVTGDRHDQGSFSNRYRRVCRRRTHRSSRVCPPGRSQTVTIKEARLVTADRTP